MSEDWLGCRVSLDCGSLGFFQGDISTISLEEQTITLRNSFQNGLPSKYPEITLRAGDIQDLKILASREALEREQRAASSSTSSTVVTLTKKKVKDTTRKTNQAVEKEDLEGKGSGSSNSRHQQQEAAPSKGRMKPLPLTSLLAQQQQQQEGRRRSPAINRSSPKKGYDGDGIRSRTFSEVGTGTRTPPVRLERLRLKDEDCFSPSVENMHDDFDFEKNLALFDKETVFSAIDQELSNRPDIVRLVDCNKRAPEPKYRHDENVLSTVVAEYRQITTGEDLDVDFVTDSGLLVPAISVQLRAHLLSAIDSHGLGVEKQAELMGRAATELALQLLGGQHRLAVNNSHQLPLAVVLCGTTGQPGAVGLAAARQLASHGVRTQVYLPELAHQPQAVETELRLYRLTGGKVVSRAKDLPKGSVDIILTALEDQEMWSQDRCQPWHRSAVAWAAASRAPVLAIEPPPYEPPLPTRMTLMSVLPLAQPPQAGKLYLANLGIPNNIYKEAGIKYASPFGAKFVIPLYPR